MTVAELMAGKRRSHQHQRIGLRIEITEERDERLVQSTQPAALDPTFEQDQQIADTRQRAQLSEADIVQRGRQQIIERAAHANAPGRSCAIGLP